MPAYAYLFKPPWIRQWRGFK